MQPKSRPVTVEAYPQTSALPAGSARRSLSPIPSFPMAGHNKWSKVKHIKARVDVAKGKVFGRCAHEIAIAARDGGGDPAMNPRLRAAIDNAKSVSMPKDKIERAVLKGLGELGGEAIQETSYEGYGPQGTAFLVEAATDNLNRTAADVRAVFSKNGGSVATPGSVAYQFDRKGEIRIPADALDADAMMEAAILAGADDVGLDEDEHVVLTAPAELAAVAAALREAGHPLRSEKLVSLPQTPVVLDDPATATQVLQLYEKLEGLDDTLNVFTNFEFADEVLAALEA